MFFGKKQQCIETDSFDLLKSLTMHLIHYECPEHRTQHHILYTLNSKKQKLLENLNELKTMEITFPTFQQLAMRTRHEVQTTITEWNELEKLYLLTLDEQNRRAINHALSFDSEKIEQLQRHFTNQYEIYEQLDRKKEFFALLKLELLQITEKISYSFS